MAAKNRAVAGRRVAPVQNQHPLDLVDALLAQYRPFGDSDYIHTQLQLRYQGRLSRLASSLPLAGELVRALDRAAPYTRYRVVGDPAVRYAVQQALAQVVNQTPDSLPLGECEDVFRETIRLLKEGKRGGPLEAGLGHPRRLGRDPSWGWIWSEEHSDDACGRTFRREVHDYFQGEPLCTPDAVDLAKLAKGAELLGILLPASARSAFSHAHVVVLVPHVGRWMRKASASEFWVGGAIFLNREMLDNPWWVAEHLFHESLHQKLYDFRHTHSLLAQDLSPESSPTRAAVRSIWNLETADRSNYWDTFRAVAAFHVYVHLALLCLQSERRGADLAKRFGTPTGSFPAMVHRREAVERAQYLGRAIKESCWQELGPAGQLLIDWLISVLNALDPSPPPPHSFYLHLLLNRYLVEATLLADRKISPEHAAQLLKIVDEEAETVRGVLCAIHAEEPDLNRLGEAAARRGDEGAQAAFLRFRGLVAKTLLRHCPDGYGLRGPTAADSMALDTSIQAMVEQSSRQVTPLLDARA